MTKTSTSKLRQSTTLTPDSPTCTDAPCSESLKMTPERVGGSLVFIHSDTAVLSNAARRTARSHAATFSQPQRPRRKAKLKPPKDYASITGRSKTSAESSVCDPDDVSPSPASQECPHLISPYPSLSPATLLDTALLDPFESTALPMSRKMSGLLKGCSFFSGRRSFPLKTMTDAFNDWTLPLVLQDPTLLRATMCMASAEMEIRRRTMPDGIRPSHAAADPLDGTMAVSDYAYFKLQAIRHLNRTLCSPDTGQLSAANICAIMFLLWAEWHCGNYRDIQAHLSGLQQAINLAGGINEFPLPVVLTIMSVVYVCSAMACTRPPLRPPVLGIHRLSQSTREAIERSPDRNPNPMSTGFFTPSNRRLLNPAIIRAVSNIHLYLRFRQLFCGDSIRPAPEEVEFFYMRHCGVEYDLLSLPFDPTLEEALTPLENAVRLTLFVFGFATYTRFEPSSAYTLAIVDQLKEALELVDTSTLWTSALLLWTLFFGAHIARHTQERTWFVTHFASNVSQLGLGSVDAVQGVLETFFFLKPFSRASLLEIWDEAGCAIEQQQQAPSATREHLPNRPSTAFVCPTEQMPPGLKALSTGPEFLAWDPYPVRG